MTASGQRYIDDLLDTDIPTVAPTPSEATMDFTIKRWLLQAMLDKAAMVIATRDPMPVLKNIQFTLTAGRLRVVATDMERWMSVTTEMVTVAVPGVAVFPAKRMLDILRSATEGPVRIRVGAGIARIAVGSTMWKLPLMPGHDYPVLPEITEATYVSLDKDHFARAVTSVRHAASKEAERAPLMMINCAGGKMIASDGSRFQQATLGDDLPFDFKLPIGAVADLLKLIKASEEITIGIGDSPRHLVFQLGNDQFVVGKLVAQFPDTQRMLLRPALENKHRLSVDREQLRDAIRRVRIAADTNTAAIMLRLSTDTLTVVARDTLNNEAEESIPAGWQGADRCLAVNHAFLSDMLRVHGPRDAVFWLGDDTKTRRTPLMLKDPDAGTVGVVQQMNLYAGPATAPGGAR